MSGRSKRLLGAAASIRLQSTAKSQLFCNYYALQRVALHRRLKAKYNSKLSSPKTKAGICITIRLGLFFQEAIRCASHLSSNEKQRSSGLTNSKSYRFHTFRRPTTFDYQPLCQVENHTRLDLLKVLQRKSALASLLHCRSTRLCNRPSKKSWIELLSNWGRWTPLASPNFWSELPNTTRHRFHKALLTSRT